MARNLKKVGDPGGWFATTIANILVFITAPWVAIVSGAVAILVAAFSYTRAIVLSPPILAAIVVWLVIWWTYVGFRVIRHMKETVRTSQVWDYAWSLTPDGSVLGFDKDSADAAIQIQYIFRNVANGPIRVKVEEFRLLIGDRTIPDVTGIEMVFPRMATRGIRSAGFKKDVAVGRPTGELKVAIIYGPIGEPFQRRYIVRAKLHFSFDEGKIGMSDEYVSESDDPI